MICIVSIAVCSGNVNRSISSEGSPKVPDAPCTRKKKFPIAVAIPVTVFVHVFASFATGASANKEASTHMMQNMMQNKEYTPIQEVKVWCPAITTERDNTTVVISPPVKMNLKNFLQECSASPTHIKNVDANKITAVIAAATYNIGQYISVPRT